MTTRRNPPRSYSDHIFFASSQCWKNTSTIRPMELAGQWKGSSDPNARSETVDTMAEEEPVADSGAVRDESQIGITSEASANQQEIARRREIVRQFFNDFWVSADDKPSTFAERLNRAEDHIN